MIFSGPEFARVKLVSFDIFDTIIARRCGPPASIFRLVEKKVRDRNLLEAHRHFDSERIQAEQRARHHKGGRDVTLEEIYAELNCLWCLPEVVLRQIIGIELETERENLFAIPGGIAMVDATRKSGKRLAFTSDMYLPQLFLRDVLEEFGLINDGEALYVSSAWGASKADGRLYQVLLEQEKLPAREVLHIGDSLHADFQNARKAALNARHLDRGTLNRFESALAVAEASCSDGVAKLAGIARLARLETDCSGRQAIPARFGASVAGPLLTLYAEWVLRTASNRGIKRLFFLARDGEALMRICQVLAPAMGLEALQLRYLYGSRQTWYPARLMRCDEGAAEFFASTVAFSASSWQDCVAYLGLKPEDQLLASLTQRWVNRGRGVNVRRQLFLDLVGSEELGPIVREWLSTQAKLTSRYLREAGAVGSEPSALVDCGWSGTWTDILGDLITAQGGVRPEVYFLGRRRANKNASRSPTFTYLFDHQAGTGLQSIPDYFHILVEFALTANQGRTLGFTERDGRLEPVLAPIDLQGFSPQEWSAFRNALLRFAELYAREIAPERSTPDLRVAFVGLVSSVWERPSMGEAAFLGRHKIGLSPVMGREEALARSYVFRDVVRLACRFRLPGYPPYWWHEGAQALTPAGPRAFMALLWEGRELVRRLLVASRAQVGFRSVPLLVLCSLKKLRWQLRPLAETPTWPTEASTASLKPKSHQPTEPTCRQPTSLAPIIAHSE